MADILSEKARTLISRPILATLATVNADGSPQATPLWVDLDGDDVRFNTARTPQEGPQRHPEQPRRHDRDRP